jgi:hypothetical protein
MRRNFKPQVMIQAWDRAGGHCDMCGPMSMKLVPGNIFYDHIIADNLGGEPTLENCQVLCRSHHDAKTYKSDVPLIAKGRRLRRREAGIRKPRRTIGGRRFNGQPIFPRWRV